MDISKEIFETGIARVCDRLDSIDGRIDRMEKQIEKIETQGTSTNERLIRLETQFHNSCKEFEEHKRDAKEEFDDVFTKMRKDRDELGNLIDSRINAANTEQNLKIISKSVLASGTIIGFITAIYKFVVWVIGK